MNKRLYFSSLLVMVFGMIVLGCGDNSINGTWVSDSGEIKYKNGNYEDSWENTIMLKGTYTLKDGQMTSKVTHFYGKYFSEFDDFTGVDTKWYSINELITVLKKVEFSDDRINFSNSFIRTPYTMSYSIEGNTLSLKHDNGKTLIFTRK